MENLLLFLIISLFSVSAFAEKVRTPLYSCTLNRSVELYIVADTAERAEQIDIARAEAARQRAEELMKQQQIADVDYARIQAKLEKELARVRVGKKYRKFGPGLMIKSETTE